MSIINGNIDINHSERHHTHVHTDRCEKKNYGKHRVWARCRIRTASLYWKMLLIKCKMYSWHLTFNHMLTFCWNFDIRSWFTHKMYGWLAGLWLEKFLHSGSFHCIPFFLNYYFELVNMSTFPSTLRFRAVDAR